MYWVSNPINVFQVDINLKNNYSLYMNLTDVDLHIYFLLRFSGGGLSNEFRVVNNVIINL